MSKAVWVSGAALLQHLAPEHFREYSWTRNIGPGCSKTICLVSAFPKQCVLLFYVLELASCVNFKTLFCFDCDWSEYLWGQRGDNLLCHRWSALAGDQLEKCPLTVIPVVVFISDLYPRLFNMFFLRLWGRAKKVGIIFLMFISLVWGWFLER